MSRFTSQIKWISGLFIWIQSIFKLRLCLFGLFTFWSVSYHSSFPWGTIIQRGASFPALLLIPNLHNTLAQLTGAISLTSAAVFGAATFCIFTCLMHWPVVAAALSSAQHKKKKKNKLLNKCKTQLKWIYILLIELLHSQTCNYAKTCRNNKMWK